MDMRKPDWLRAKLPTSPEYKAVREIVDNNDLHTVCKSAQCPNMGECWSRGTATVMILGNICTRSCTFCAIQTGRPTELDIGEPARVAESIARMNLKHAVITSVARDDLKDGGATVWAATIRAIHHRMPAFLDQERQNQYLSQSLSTLEPSVLSLEVNDALNPLLKNPPRHTQGELF